MRGLDRVLGEERKMGKEKAENAVQVKRLLERRPFSIRNFPDAPELKRGF